MHLHSTERAPRRPLYVQVVTQPALQDCWAVDLSTSGIGLMTSQSGGDTLADGDTLTLQFVLPGNGISIVASGVVSWTHRHEATQAVGVTFTDLDPTVRAELSRYLDAYRFHIGVAASSEEMQILRTALGEHVHLH